MELFFYASKLRNLIQVFKFHLTITNHLELLFLATWAMWMHELWVNFNCWLKTTSLTWSFTMVRCALKLHFKTVDFKAISPMICTKKMGKLETNLWDKLNLLPLMFRIRQVLVTTKKLTTSHTTPNASQCPDPTTACSTVLIWAPLILLRFRRSSTIFWSTERIN